MISQFFINKLGVLKTRYLFNFLIILYFYFIKDIQQPNTRSMLSWSRPTLIPFLVLQEYNSSPYKYNNIYL